MIRKYGTYPTIHSLKKGIITAYGIINGTTKQKISNAINMRFYLLRNRSQEN